MTFRQHFFPQGVPVVRLFSDKDKATRLAIADCIENQTTLVRDDVDIRQLDGREQDGVRNWNPMHFRTRVGVSVDAQSLAADGLAVYCFKRKTNARRPTPGDILWCNIASTLHPPEVVSKHMAVVMAVHRYEHEVAITVLPISSAERNASDSWRMFMIPRDDHYKTLYRDRIKDSYVICDQPQTFDLRRFDPIIRDGQQIQFSMRPEDFRAVQLKFMERMKLTLPPAAPA